MNHGPVHKTNNGKEFRKEMEEQQVQRRVRRRLNHCEYLKRIMDPAIQHPMIDYLTKYFDNKGVVVDTDYILVIWPDFWNYDDINKFTMLWNLLYKPPLSVISTLGTTNHKTIKELLDFGLIHGPQV